MSTFLCDVLKTVLFASVISDEYKTKYTYDSFNRLKREDNPILNQTIIYKYDNGGNILLKKIYKYTLSEELVGGEVIRYTYKTNGWKDQLVNYNGMTIEYDEMGRPYNYGDTSIKWNLKRKYSIIWKSSCVIWTNRWRYSMVDWFIIGGFYG